MLEYNRLNEELKGTINELKRTKDKLDSAENDINEKTKYANDLKEIQEKFDYQYAKVKVIELESELNEKNKNINILENNIRNLENKSNTNNKKIQKLEKELKENDEYFDNYEKDRIEN